MKQLIAYIEEFTTLTNEAKMLLEECMEYEFVKKKSFILHEGNKCNKVWFVIRGMLRKFYIHDGEEVTTWIHTEGEMLTSLNGYVNNSASTESIVACEDSELIVMTRENSLKLNSNSCFIEFNQKHMAKKMSCIDEVTKKLNVMNTEEKYNYLFQNFPQMMKRAKSVHIASILRVAPETISRIRARR